MSQPQSDLLKELADVHSAVQLSLKDGKITATEALAIATEVLDVAVVIHERIKGDRQEQLPLLFAEADAAVTRIFEEVMDRANLQGVARYAAAQVALPLAKRVIRDALVSYLGDE